jgi:hypothetical protein
MLMNLFDFLSEGNLKRMYWKVYDVNNRNGVYFMFFRLLSLAGPTQEV